jgi:hypothetical protein
MRPMKYARSHLAAQHIEELRQLVDTRLAESPAHRGDAGIAFLGPHGRRATLGVDDHCAELIDRERAAEVDQYSAIATATVGVGARGRPAAVARSAIDPDALLPVKHRSRRGRLDQDGGQNYDRGGNDESHN